MFSDSEDPEYDYPGRVACPAQQLPRPPLPSLPDENKEVCNSTRQGVGLEDRKKYEQRNVDENGEIPNYMGTKDTQYENLRWQNEKPLPDKGTLVGPGKTQK